MEKFLGRHCQLGGALARVDLFEKTKLSVNLAAERKSLLLQWLRFWIQTL
jgi:hypothetical protein